MTQSVHWQRRWRLVVAGAVAVAAMVLSGSPALAAAPVNDDFGSATHILTLPFSESSTTAEATTAADDPSCVGRGYTVWYSFTPSTNLRITANTFGSRYDTTLSAYVGTRGSLTQVVCNDDTAGTAQSRIDFDATAGVTYFFMIGAYGFSPGGALTFSLDSLGVTLVDSTSPGYYNASLGTSLDGTQPQFPCADVACGDPFLLPAPEPNLSSVNAILGDWLSANPLPLNANWSGLQPIPPTWAVNTETAIVYPIDAGPGGMSDVTGEFGVDNGMFIWVNGIFKFGAVEPGGTIFGEYQVDLGNLPPGMNYVQILREDHGVATGYDVLITGKPLEAPITHETMTSVSCSPNPALLDGSTTCMASVLDESAMPTTPTGTVSWSTSSSGGAFDSTTCALTAVPGVVSQAACQVTYTATAVGSHRLAAAYSGDGSHTASSDATSLAVIYQFSGFRPPIDNVPVVNKGKAGKTYPVKFPLQNANGTYISQLNAIRSILQKRVDCANFSDDPSDTIEASSSGNSSLRYDASANQFIYNWQTPSTPGCYVLFLNLDDGETYRANFDLTKQ